MQPKNYMLKDSQDHYKALENIFDLALYLKLS